MSDEQKTTTWGDCPTPTCRNYGRMVYGIEPGDICDDSERHGNGCYTTLRWWDRWHDGKHSGEHGIVPCESERQEVTA